MFSVGALFFSAVLLTLCIPPFDFYWCVFFALIPLFLTIENARSKRELLAHGFLLSLFFGVLSFRWSTTAVQTDFDLSWFKAVLFTAPLFLLHQPQFLIFPFCLKFCLNRWPRGWRVSVFIIGLAGFYTWLDHTVPKFFMDSLGDAFARQDPWRQVSEYAGFSILTFFAILSNLSIWVAIRAWRRYRKSSLRKFENTLPLLLCLGLGVLLAITGFEGKKAIVNDMSRPIDNIYALVIQPGFDSDTKKSASFIEGANHLLDVQLEMSRRALREHPETDFIIWPETSFPGFFRQGSNNASRLRDHKLEEFVKTSGRSLIFGGFYIDYTTQSTYNGLYVLDSDGAL